MLPVAMGPVTAPQFRNFRPEKRTQDLSLLAVLVFLSLCFVFSSNGDHYKLAASDITRSIRGNNSKVTEVSGRTEKQCERSMKASYDFICESDQSWELRKEIFQKQEAIQIQPGKDFYYWKDMGIWFQNNYEPNFSCRHERRIGRPGDGGKWVCNPHRILEIAKEQHKQCVVFSIGSNNDFSFEEAVLNDLPGCEVHTFDHTITPKKVPPGVHFHPWGLGTSNSGKVKTLATILKELKIGANHSLEILKADIEGHEWDVFVGSPKSSGGGLLSRQDFPFVRQILIELHPKPSISATKEFFQLMGSQNYVITHKEPNTYQGGKLTEYAFLKADMMQR